MSYNLRTSMSWARTMQDLEATFDKWHIHEWRVDPMRIDSRKSYWGFGERRVTVTFKTRQGEERSFSMDKQERPVDNLRVLYLALEAIRLNETRGIGELVREMYMALPAPARERDPYEVLGIRPDAPLELAEAAYRTLSRSRHPDNGGSNEAMAELNAAIGKVRAKR